MAAGARATAVASATRAVAADWSWPSTEGARAEAWAAETWSPREISRRSREIWSPREVIPTPNSYLEGGLGLSPPVQGVEGDARARKLALEVRAQASRLRSVRERDRVPSLAARQIGICRAVQVRNDTLIIRGHSSDHGGAQAG